MSDSDRTAPRCRAELPTSACPRIVAIARRRRGGHCSGMTNAGSGGIDPDGTGVNCVVREGHIRVPESHGGRQMRIGTSDLDHLSEDDLMSAMEVIGHLHYRNDHGAEIGFEFRLTPDGVTITRRHDGVVVRTLADLWPEDALAQALEIMFRMEASGLIDVSDPHQDLTRLLHVLAMAGIVWSRLGAEPRSGRRPAA